MKLNSERISIFGSLWTIWILNKITSKISSKISFQISIKTSLNRSMNFRKNNKFSTLNHNRIILTFQKLSIFVIHLSGLTSLEKRMIKPQIFLTIWHKSVNLNWPRHLVCATNPRLGVFCVPFFQFPLKLSEKNLLTIFLLFSQKVPQKQDQVNIYFW